MHSISWPARVVSRVRNHLLLKIVGTSIFITLFFVAYIWLLKNPLYPVTLVPLTVPDRLVSFVPESLFIYLTLWVYVSLPPALLVRRSELHGYGTAIAAVCVIGLICFLFWPTAVPSNRIYWDLHPEIDLLKGIDAAGNACPSLHVATAVFSGIWLHGLLKETAAPRMALAINALWCLGIVYSTMSTKQHLFLDVTAGTILGIAGAWLSLNWRQQHLARIST